MKPPEELVAKAERLQENGYDQEAFQIWKNLANKYRDPDALFRFALLAKELGELDEATNALNLLLKIEPEFEGAHLILASIAISRHDYEEAEGYLRKALSFEETRAGFTMLGVVLHHLS